MKKKVFITGITGQDGAYLSKYLINLGYQVHGSIRSDSTNTEKLQKLNILREVRLHVVDLEHYSDIKALLDSIRPDYVVNFAAQSSVSQSFLFPLDTLKPNLTILLNLLEYIRGNIKTKLFQASSSEMYGNPSNLPVQENHSLNPISPYGLSKALGHLIVRFYRETYGLYVVSGILFNHESFLRDESFFIKKLIKQSIKIKFGLQENIKLGNLDVNRDFGFSGDYVEVIFSTLLREYSDDYIISTGKSTKLRDIVNYVFNSLGLSKSLIIESSELYRSREIINIYGDNSKTKLMLGLGELKSIWEIIDDMIKEEFNSFNDN